jgi:hydroxymethylpyrimidine pyrophosphatase-like HAD family hydrolase
MGRNGPSLVIRLVAVDLDGTLLGDDGHVSARNAAALAADIGPAGIDKTAALRWLTDHLNVVAVVLERMLAGSVA